MTRTVKRAAIYARVSTDGQTTENQVRELEEAAARAGWQIVERFVDTGVSGAKGRSDRPSFRRLWDTATQRKVDVVMAWSVDRLGRSLQDLVAFLAELHALKVDLYLHQQGLDTTTPAGRAMFGMLGVFAEFERAMIQDRVRSGLDRARSQGKTLGRPRTDAETEAAIRQDLATGRGIRKIAREIGVGVSVVQRIQADMRSAAEANLA